MRETLLRFITIQPLNYHPIIAWALAFIWLMLVANCVASLRRQPLGLTARWVWALVLVAIPIGGMCCYLFYCLFKADYSFLKFVLGPPRQVRGKGIGGLRLPDKTVQVSPK